MSLRLPALRAIRSARISPAPAPALARRAHTAVVADNTEVDAQVDAVNVLPQGEEVDPQLAGQGYPQLPYISLQRRPAKGWWDNQERKNFGETFHEEEDVLGMWGPDVHATSGPSALTQMAIAATVLAGFGYIVASTRSERPVAKRSYPFGGLVEELGGEDVKARAESEEDAE